MVELKWNLQFSFNSGQFHFAIPIPIPWLAIPIPILIPELELELKSIPIPIPELTPALFPILVRCHLYIESGPWFQYLDACQQKVSLQVKATHLLLNPKNNK